MKDYLREVDKLLKREADPAYARRAKIIFENLGLSGEETVLEVGCGRGFYVNNLAIFFPKTKIWGIDLNEDYLKQARRGKGKNEKLIIADATKLPFKDNYFDRIIASEILEHIPDDKKAVREINRVLKPGGILLVTVPNRNYPFLWDPINWILERILKIHLPSNIWWLSGIWADHQRLYSENEIEKLINEYGFKITKRWQTTHYCLPFSHFIFYGIGKNIVEKGWLPSFNRFKQNTESGFFNKVLLWPVKIVDRLNSNQSNKGSSVNLVYKIKK